MHDIELPASLCLCPHTEAVVQLYNAGIDIDSWNSPLHNTPDMPNSVTRMLFQHKNASYSADAQLHAAMLHDDTFPSLVYWHKEAGWECMEPYHTSQCCDHIVKAAAGVGKVVCVDEGTSEIHKTHHAGWQERKILSHLAIPPDGSPAFEQYTAGLRFSRGIDGLLHDILPDVPTSCTCTLTTDACTCGCKCGICGSDWDTVDTSLHRDVTVYSFPAYGYKSHVGYWVRKCSSLTCLGCIQPEGLSAGVMLMNDKLAFDHLWLYDLMDDVEISGSTEDAMYQKMRRTYGRSLVSTCSNICVCDLCTLGATPRRKAI